jgi:hypothetical protein
MMHAHPWGDSYKRAAAKIVWPAVGDFGASDFGLTGEAFYQKSDFNAATMANALGAIQLNELSP